MQEVVDHLFQEHKDIASEDLPGLLSLSSQHGMGIEACPLCHESGPRDSPELIKHVMEHMHEFSLLSLPWSREEVELGAGTVSFDFSSPVFSSRPRLSGHFVIKEKFDLHLRREGNFEKLKDRLERWFNELESHTMDPEVVHRLLRDYESRPTFTEKGDIQDHPSFFIDRLYFSEPTSDGSVGTGTLSQRDAVNEDPKLQIIDVPNAGLEPKYALAYAACILIVLDLCKRALSIMDQNDDTQNSYISGITELTEYLVTLPDALDDFLTPDANDESPQVDYVSVRAPQMIR